MVRNLYRCYLYVICLALLVFATVGLTRLLQVVLAFTPLRGPSGSVPGNPEIVQSVVFFAISWIITAALGGLHYWLLRRDMRSDPAAEGSAIRAFFLNIAEGIAVLLAVALSAFFVIQSLGEVYSGDVTVLAATSLAMFCFAGLLEWERQRTQVRPGAATLFQHLHLYGVQLILLLFLTMAWFGTVRPLMDALVFGGQGALSVGAPPPCGGFTVCQGPNLLSFSVALLWVALFWIGYGLLARGEQSSLFRQVLHYTSLTFGLGLVLYGVELGIELVLRAVFGIAVAPQDVASPAANYDFVSPITLGLLVVGIYSLWLVLSARREPQGRVVVLLVGEAITASLLALAFWWGIGLALFHLLERVAGVQVKPGDWASACAFIITGVSYVELDLYLQRRSSRDPAVASAPRRGMVFALLGGGMLAGAVGAATALYALGTFLLGSPVSDWSQVARVGFSACVVGAFVVGVYLWRMRDEHLLIGKANRPPSTEITTPAVEKTMAAPATTEAIEPSVAIEAILDDLLAGKITRDEAAAQLHALLRLQPSHA